MTTELKRQRIPSLVMLVFFVLIFGFLFASNAMACHRGTPHGNQSSCDEPPPPPPDDGGSPPTEVNTHGWWVNVSGIPNAMKDHDLEPADGEPDRECTPEGFQPNGEHGNNHCWHLVERWPYPVSFDLSGVSQYEQTKRRGDPQLCEVLRAGTVSLVANGKFGYAWEGNCKDSGGCLVRIINWFNGQQVLDAISATQPGATAADRLVLHGLAQLQIDPDDDANPFYVQRIIFPDTLEATFVGEGTNKTVAECIYNMTTANPRAVFESIPR